MSPLKYTFSIIYLSIFIITNFRYKIVSYAKKEAYCGGFLSLSSSNSIIFTILYTLANFKSTSLTTLTYNTYTIPIIYF